MCDWEFDYQGDIMNPAAFQSLKGIMCDWEEAALKLSSDGWVSIPERDYVWLRGRSESRSRDYSTFQSLKGIMCDWEFHNSLVDAALEVSIPERDYVWLRAGHPEGIRPPQIGFQSLKGIMCDWEN